MAQNTDPRLQNQVIYSIYVRAHTPEGTFRAVIPDLDRIKALGVDIIWFMPIHPIGVKGKKGSMGCPYANRDYRSVNPEYGTMDDFKMLCEEIHQRGMKVMIDVVYNHTSPDSVLWETHPEFFYKRPDGTPGNHVGEWYDVIDLDYNVPELWDYQVESLTQWAKIVDGYRCVVFGYTNNTDYDMAVRDCTIWGIEVASQEPDPELTLYGIQMGATRQEIADVYGEPFSKTFDDENHMSNMVYQFGEDIHSNQIVMIIFKDKKAVAASYDDFDLVVD